MAGLLGDCSFRHIYEQRGPGPTDSYFSAERGYILSPPGWVARRWGQQERDEKKSHQVTGRRDLQSRRRGYKFWGVNSEAVMCYNRLAMLATPIPIVLLLFSALDLISPNKA